MQSRFKQRARMAMLAMLGVLASQAVIAAAPQPPADARAAGFTTLTYDADTGTSSGQAKLYPWNFLHYVAPAFSRNDRGVALAGGGGYNAQVATATFKGPGSFDGVAFGGGGYFEATFSFKPPSPTDPQTAWAAFWAMSVEHLAAMPAVQWPGKPPGFEHFAEVDVFEYNVHRNEHRPNVYGGSYLEWYGVWGKTCTKFANRFCEVQVPYREKLRPVPPGTDFSQPHRYGVLWIPATDSAPGHMAWYFDGNRVGATLEWKKATDFSQHDEPGDLSFSILDQQHLVFIAGTGAASPLNLTALRAWQRDARANLPVE